MHMTCLASICVRYEVVRTKNISSDDDTEKSTAVALMIRESLYDTKLPEQKTSEAMTTQKNPQQLRL